MWQEHLLKMDHLRSDVTLRAVGQRDPLMEFKRDAFEMFNALSDKLKADIAHDLFRFEIIIRMPKIEETLKNLQLETNRSLAPELEEAPKAVEAQASQQL